MINILSKAEAGAINSGKDVKYFLTQIEETSGVNPLYIKRCVNDRMSELGIKSSHVQDWVASWGDMDAEIAHHKMIEENYKDVKEEWPAQYYGAVKEIKKLMNAKEIINNNEIIG